MVDEMPNVDDVRIAQLEVENNELRKHLEKVIKSNVQLRWDIQKLEMYNAALMVGLCAVREVNRKFKEDSIKQEIESALSFLKTKDEVSIAG